MENNNSTWWTIKIVYLLAEIIQMIIVTIILGYIVGKLGTNIKNPQFFLILKNCWNWIVFYFGVGIFKITMDYFLKNLEK
ncbi:hypothetical protein GCM10022297_09680 [Lactobacillus hamsteri]|uniref:hypothetical protein n=1 Tax=Lactobacillus hamsteri TaxID=96565 RepID=UPI000469B7C6|nr:hypothetical protein [Lactobacillus hamsteri]